ncbi:MAG TPA: HAD-IB family phosphatase [Anseongella sp.]
MKYIIDFDSTFTQVEALDELVRISLADHPNRNKIFKEIESLTNAAMEGRLSFSESLERRVKLLHANKKHLGQLVKVLKKKVSQSFSRNSDFFRKHHQQVFIVSGGFKEFITPVVATYHIPPENIFANTFLFDFEGNIVGYDKQNPLSEEGGKVKLLRQLNWKDDVFVIGDGYSDFQLKEAGIVKKFFAFTENIERAAVAEKADHVTPSFDEFLYVNKLPMAISYPKNRIKCLLLGKVPKETTEILKAEGYSIRQKSADEVEDKYLRDMGILVAVAGEKLSNKWIDKCARLKVIGYLGNSNGMVDHEYCARRGIVILDDKRNNHYNIQFIPKRVIDFVNTGSTYSSVNFPDIQLFELAGAHRFIHIHENKPGIMARINEVFARHQINILAQYLKTNDYIGYVITDVNAEYDKAVIDDLKKIPHTVKFRMLY